MRTNIEIDDKLMAQVMKAGAFRTKREAVAEALKAYITAKQRPKMLDLFGKLDWDGYPIDEIRRDLPPVGGAVVNLSGRAKPRARSAK